MSLFDFLFPDVAQATHLRRLADATAQASMQSRLSQARGNQQRLSAEKRVQELESEVAQLTLVVEALIEKLVENGVTNREDLASKIAEIDLSDGVEDGRITPPPPSSQPKTEVQFNFPD